MVCFIKKQKYRSQAFTLLEILIALVISSIFILSLYGTQLKALHRSTEVLNESFLLLEKHNEQQQ